MQKEAVALVSIAVMEALKLDSILRLVQIFEIEPQAYKRNSLTLSVKIIA